MVGKEWNSKILVNLPATHVPLRTGINAKTLGLKNMQFHDMGESYEPPYVAPVVHHRTDELLIHQHSVRGGVSYLGG